MAWWTLAALLLCLSIVCCEESIEEFTSSTLINNVVQDPLTGRIYVGAVNAIYQLDSLLKQEKKVETGPKRDSRHCTPPIQSCHDAKWTDNTNKLLLVHPSNGSLIVCGSLFKGICSLQNLSNINQMIYYSDSKGEKTYVASSEEMVSVVGVMSTFTKESKDTFDVFVVGKGYGSQDNTKLISTRILQDFDDWVVFENIVEASAVQATPFVQKYMHNFRYSFKESGFIYFLFTRTRGVPDNKNFTFISRLCEDDHHYYSYTELQLSCGPNNLYNKAQAAFISSPGEKLAQYLSASGQYGQVQSQDKILFVASSTDEDKPRSGLCMYPLRSINQQIMEIISACYTKNGKIGNKIQDTLIKYKCGADFLPSPLASTPDFALPAQAVHTTTDLLTAVAIAVETEHTVAFLGTSNGKMYHVHLSSIPEVYRTVPGPSSGEAVNKHLLFDRNHSHLYVTTGKKISMVPVEKCDMKKDCKSCMDLKDPYCGWCVLEGRCTRKSDCRKAGEEKHWLWSPQKQCVEITSFQPPNLSCRKTTSRHSCLPCVRCLKNLKMPHNPHPSLIPVGYETSIEFTGENLHVYEVKDFFLYIYLLTNNCCETLCMEVVKKWMEICVMCADGAVRPPPVTLYNCAMGREDCSLCKSADPIYKCMWCDETKSCEYQKRCRSAEESDCPNPEITDIIPRYGPLKGGISVTIKGSNLGIVKEDIESITVAGQPCMHQEEKYSVSTSVVCEISGVEQKHSGVVEVKVKGGKSGTSSVVFTYRDPRPERVQPNRGPQAGGTLITITGTDLETGSKDDLNITVGGVVWLNACDLILLQLSNSIVYAFCHLQIKFGHGQWIVGSVEYEKKTEAPLDIIIPAVIAPMVVIIIVSVYCYRRKSQQAEREYEKVKHQLENLEESVRDRCKKEFTDLMIEMEDHTSDLSEARIPFLDYKTYTDRVFFLPSKDGANDVMITGKLDIPEARRATVTQALNQFSNLLNSKPFLINFIRTLEGRPDFNARSRGYFASLLTVALHGKLEYYTDIMRTLLLELMEQYVQSKNPKLMLRRSETVVERMLCNWMSICLYQFLKDSAGEPLYKLFKAIKHQVEKGPVDAVVKKAKYTLNDTGLLGDDVEYCTLTLQVLVHGEGPDVTLVKVLNCDTVSQVKEKIIEQVYKNLPYSQRPKVESVTLEWRPGSTGQILSDLDLTSQKEGRWKRMNTLAHYNVRDNATLVLSRVLHPLQSYDQHQDSHEERNALLEDDKVFHLVRPAEELDEVKSKRGSMKDKSMTKAITELYLTRLLSVKGTLQQFVDDFFRSVLCSSVVPPAVKYFFDFLDEQAQKHDNVDDETIHIWKTNSLPLRFWVNILKNPHFIFDVHVNEVVDASLSVIAQTFMDACTKSEHKLSRDSPSNKLLYAKEISTYKKMVDDYYKGIRQMVPVSDQDMNTHLAEVSRSHTDKLNTQVALHQLYQYASKYYDVIITSLDEDPAAQNKQLTLRLQQIAAALENKVTDL
uniref:Plexin B2 n=1 Tax=Scleropages formosus TaxID=113540 RepID=A0A8C9U7I9_SCLFO